MHPINIIINNFNLVTWPKEMVNTILGWKKVQQIFIVDNNSNYFPTLDWYKQIELHPKIKVIKMKYSAKDKFDLLNNLTNLNIDPTQDSTFH